MVSPNELCCQKKKDLKGRERSRSYYTNALNFTSIFQNYNYHYVLGCHRRRFLSLGRSCEHVTRHSEHETGVSNILWPNYSKVEYIEPLFLTMLDIAAGRPRATKLTSEKLFRQRYYRGKLTAVERRARMRGRNWRKHSHNVLLGANLWTEKCLGELRFQRCLRSSWGGPRWLYILYIFWVSL